MRTKALRTRMAALVGLALLLALAAGCASGPGTDSGDGSNGGGSRGTISGTVVNASDAPVEGATVTINTNTAGNVTTTAANGAFSFPNVLFGTYIVSATKASTGYFGTAEQSVTLNAQSPSPQITLKLQDGGTPPPPPF